MSERGQVKLEKDLTLFSGCFTIRHDLFKNLTLTLALGLFGAVSVSNASLLVYEGFDYGAASTSRSGADLLHNQPDGTSDGADATGLSGTWQDSAGPGASSDLFMYSGSLGFGDLATSGNSVRTDTNNNNDVFSRGIIPSLSGTSTGELWFSFTANKLQNNFSAAEGGIIISNQTVGNARILENDGSDGLVGFGIAPTTSGDNWTAYGWNGSSQVVGGSSLGVATDGTETNLLVGQVQYNNGVGGEDTFTLYNYVLNGGSVTGGSLSAITSLVVNADESLLNTLNLTRQVNTAYDEIR
ncbi:MAG TPA: hypothetical protein VJ952_05910, partial [Opitutales bacterium]|nr:hypothetical protein [Opitutales bacterium]